MTVADLIPLYDILKPKLVAKTYSLGKFKTQDKIWLCSDILPDQDGRIEKSWNVLEMNLS